ncbi:hypothetical protein PV325_000475 [Microctonus aethiopoides]|nr:hypothetical protein PV325_000475 [Microctonus aethiopoides]
MIDVKFALLVRIKVIEEEEEEEKGKRDGPETPLLPLVFLFRSPSPIYLQQAENPQKPRKGLYAGTELVRIVDSRPQIQHLEAAKEELASKFPLIQSRIDKPTSTIGCLIDY